MFSSEIHSRPQDKRENKRTVGTSSPRHKKYTSDGAGVAKQPKMAANIVTSSPFQKIKTVSRIRQNERLIRGNKKTDISLFPELVTGTIVLHPGWLFPDSF